MKWPADRLYNHKPWGWRCILPCQKMTLSWLFSGPWNCRSSDHLLFKKFKERQKKLEIYIYIYISIIRHRKITRVSLNLKLLSSKETCIWPQITESWFFNKKGEGWTSNQTTNHFVCACHLPTSRVHEPSKIQAMEPMAWVLAWRWSEKWYAFIMAVAQFSLGQRRVFFGSPKNGGFNRLEWG